LEPSWNGFDHVIYLVIWAFGQKNKLWQAPSWIFQVASKSIPNIETCDFLPKFGKKSTSLDRLFFA
jgi:hypothetical protein